MEAQAEVMLWNIHDEISDVINFSDIDDHSKEQLGHVRGIVLDIIRSR